MSTHRDHCDALAIALTAGTPTLLWGAPGIGKTSVIQQIATHNGWHLETVIASICDPTDFKGMPRDEHGRTVFSAPAWAHAINDANGGVVFLDEISTAPPSVQAALLRPVLERVVGDLTMPTNTRFVAAANPAGEAADGWELSAPLANRFAHLDWPVIPSVVSDGFSFGWEPIAVPTISAEAVEAQRARIRGVVGAFLNARPHLAHKMPTSSAERGRAWPSPRSWEMAIELLAHAEAAGASEGVMRLLANAAVGESAARELLHWRTQLDLPDIEEVLRKGGKVKVPTTPDKVYALCTALISAIEANPTKARCEAAVNGALLAISKAGHADLAVMAMRRIRHHALDHKAELTVEAIETFITFPELAGRILTLPGVK